MSKKTSQKTIKKIKADNVIIDKELDTKKQDLIQLIEEKKQDLNEPDKDEQIDTSTVRDNVKITCGCGVIYTKTNKVHHFKSGKHIEYEYRLKGDDISEIKQEHNNLEKQMTKLYDIIEAVAKEFLLLKQDNKNFNKSLQMVVGHLTKLTNKVDRTMNFNNKSIKYPSSETEQDSDDESDTL